MVDVIIRNFFNQYLKTFFEPLNEGALEVSLADGIVFRNLVVKPKGINEQLAKNGVDVRLERGRVGEMRLGYTAMTGSVSMQVQNVDMQIRPNAIRTVGRAIVHGINQLIASPPCGANIREMRRRHSPPIYYYPEDNYMVEIPPTDEMYGDITSFCCLGTSSRRQKTLANDSQPRRALMTQASQSLNKNGVFHPIRHPNTSQLDTIKMSNHYDPHCPDCYREAQAKLRSINKRRQFPTSSLSHNRESIPTLDPRQYYHPASRSLPR